MPDPTVHITNGVPDAGTGNITTLGQTLLDGANIVLGATTDLAATAGAAATINGHLRAISRDIVGGISLQAGANVIGAVTQSGGPWSVSGTVAATQSGTWNITNITGSIPLAPLAATSTLQPTNAGQASTTSGQTGTMAMGATTTAAPTYSNGQTNPLSLTTAGAMRVDGSAVTQPVSGTVTANQGGAPWSMKPDGSSWALTGTSANVNVTNASIAVTGTFWQATQPISAASLPLPAGAATAAGQPSVAAQGSTTSGQTGTLSEGAVTTAAPTYTTAQTSPLSLTTAGALRVDNSGVTQPISGTITANQGGNWSTRLQDGAGNAITSDARGSERPLSVQILDASGNQIVSFGAGSGPSFGSAFPTTGTAIGMKDSAGVNMVAFNANASGALKVDGSATTQPVSGTFWQATQPVSGTFWQATQPVSIAAAVTVTQTTPASLTTLANGTATTAAPSYTTGTNNPLSLNLSGGLRVDGSGVTQPVSGTFWQATQPVSGTVTANIGTAGSLALETGNLASIKTDVDNLNLSQGSTTTGQKGSLPLGAVTTAAPTYTTGQSNPLSLTTAGALRVDNSAVTQPVSGTVTASQGGTWTVQPGNTANTTPWLTSINQGGNTAAVTASSALKVDGSAITQPVSGTITANQGGNWTSRVVGNAGGIVDAAQNAAAPANELVIGGVYNSADRKSTRLNSSHSGESRMPSSA